MYELSLSEATAKRLTEDGLAAAEDDDAGGPRDDPEMVSWVLVEWGRMHGAGA